jgi:hypothetical protein
MTTPAVDIEVTAFIAMAQNLHDALNERDRFVRSYRERYTRLQEDLRTGPAKRTKAAAEFLQAAYSADHIYGERVEAGIEKYRRLTSTEAESRY